MTLYCPFETYYYNALLLSMKNSTDQNCTNILQIYKPLSHSLALSSILMYYSRHQPLFAPPWLVECTVSGTQLPVLRHVNMCVRRDTEWKRTSYQYRIVGYSILLDSGGRESSKSWQSLRYSRNSLYFMYVNQDFTTLFSKSCHWSISNSN
jgi:hypothetical protein